MAMEKHPASALKTLRANIAQQRALDENNTINCFDFGWRDFAALPFAAAAFAGEGGVRGLGKLLDAAFWLVTRLYRLVEAGIIQLVNRSIPLLHGIVDYLPALKPETRWRWKKNIAAGWDKAKVKYLAIKHRIHRWVEKKEQQVFGWGKKLPPDKAMFILIAASLFVPVSTALGFAGHFLIGKFLPLSLQWLQILPISLPKLKIFLLPLYPAAWPQAKKSALIKRLSASPFLRKTGYQRNVMKQQTLRALEAAGLKKPTPHVTPKPLHSVKNNAVQPIDAQKIRPRKSDAHSGPSTRSGIISMLFSKIKSHLTVREERSALRSHRLAKGPLIPPHERLAAIREGQIKARRPSYSIAHRPVARGRLLESTQSAARKNLG